MEYIIVALLLITIVLLIITLLVLNKVRNSQSTNNEAEEELEQMNGRIEALQQLSAVTSSENKIYQQTVSEKLTNQTNAITKQVNEGFNYILTQNKNSAEASDRIAKQAYEQQNLLIKGNSKLTIDQLTNTQESINKRFDSQSQLIAERFDSQSKAIAERFDAQHKIMEDSFTSMRKENNEQLEKIRESMNERLDKTLNEQFDKSFKGVIEQMSNLSKSMGELKGISTQVGSLEKALNGVKTRGIIGERQLKLIIQDVLNPHQYDVEVPTFPDSNDHVEIAIKLPDRNSDGWYYLPVDSKCHTDRYEALVTAQESGDPLAVEAARKELANAIKQDAKNIANKYIKEPYTTPYAILFVPFEGMYSEIVNLSLLEELNKMHITVVGPYTMMAVLSTIVNYWQALAIEKKSRDIELTLSKTKDAFTKFDAQLSKVRNQLNTASKSLDELQSRRTNAVLRALRGVSNLAEGETNNLLPESTYDDDKSFWDGGFDE